MVATGLIRERWLDCVAAAPPLLVWIGFKIWMSRTAEQEFRYYVPTPEEQEAERYRHENEKRTRHSEMEKRFLHPALQADKLFTVMVHKEQEQLAREVLAAYPWFNKVKAVREENLEYDPTRDGPADAVGKAEWDAKSIASTDMLRSEGVTPFMTPGTVDTDVDSLYKQYPFPARESPSGFNSRVNLPYDNPSTDQLIPSQSRAEDYATPRRASRHMAYRDGQEPIITSPLLDRSQADDQGNYAVPYPPTSFNQPPHGYTPPAMRRMPTDYSDSSSNGGGDIGAPRAAVTYGGYDDPYEPYVQPSRQASGDDLNNFGAPRRPSGYQSGGYDLR
jgi:hypothetical protein